ncbi:MAG: hypothetical protein ACXU8U_11840, partial [Asticcacaulis sp.]
TAQTPTGGLSLDAKNLQLPAQVPAPIVVSDATRLAQARSLFIGKPVTALGKSVDFSANHMRDGLNSIIVTRPTYVAQPQNSPLPTFMLFRDKPSSVEVQMWNLDPNSLYMVSVYGGDGSKANPKPVFSYEVQISGQPLLKGVAPFSPDGNGVALIPVQSLGGGFTVIRLYDWTDPAHNWGWSFTHITVTKVE